MIRHQWLLTIYILSLFCFSAFAQNAEERFRYQSKDFRTDFETNVTVMEGNAVIESDLRKLRADKMEIVGKPGDIICSGNVEYTQGPFKMSAKSAQLNVRTGLGIFHGAVMEFDNQLYMEGKSIERYELDRYRVRHGKVSLCQDCPQAWSIAGSAIDVRIEGYAEVHHALVQIKDTPVAYIPLFVFPIKTKRQSGLLPPKFANDDDMGFQIGVPYFWAISNDADATFEVRPMTKGGQRLWNETRYKYSERSYVDGRWSVTKNDQVANVPTTRWGSSFEERLQISPHWVQRYTGEWSSDPKYSGHFEEDFRRSRLPQLVHDASLNYQDSSFFALAGTRFTDDNVPRILHKEVPQGIDQKPVQSYPDVNFSAPSFSLLGPLRVDFDSTYLSLRRPYDESSAKVSGPLDPESGFIRTGDRATMQASLLAPIGTKYFSYEPEVMARVDYYSFHTSAYPASTYRVRTFFDQELSTEVWRVFKVQGDSDLKALKHSVRPFLRWSYSPTVEAVDPKHPRHPFFGQEYLGRNSPKFDLFDPNSDAESIALGTVSEEQRLSDHHLLTLGLGTRFVGRYGEDQRRYEEHFGANIGQDYDLKDRKLGRIFFDAFGAYSGWRLSTAMAIDPASRNADVDNRLSFERKHFSFNLFQSIQRGNKTAGGGGAVNDIGAFSFGFKSIYDLNLNEWQEQEYSLLYKSPSKCWFIKLTTRSKEGWWPIDADPGVPSFVLDIEYRPKAGKG